MKALGYLFFTTIKNKIFSIKKKPALLILYVIIILSIVALCFSYSKTDINNKTYNFADIRILYIIVAAVGFLFLFSLVTTGLSTGSTLFNMADVGLLFVSPTSSKKILIYGLIKQMGTTFVTAVFILFQVNTIRQSFGLSGGAIITIFFIYAIILFFCQLVSIAVYIFTNGNSNRKALVKGLLYGMFALIAVAVILLQLKYGGSILSNVKRLIDYKPFYLAPVGGWAIMFVRGTIEGELIFVLSSILLFFITSVAIISLFTTGNADYYEDVLTSTEVTYKRLQDAKDGKKTFNTKKIKVKEEQTGLRGGKGYSAIFYKHLLEKKRTSRFLFIDTYTIAVSIGAVILYKYINKDFSVYIILGILVYFQFFLTVLGKLSDELAKPFIYMIPGKSVNKVLAASVTTLLKPCVDAVIIFTIVCIFSKTSPLLNLFLALAYASSGAIFVSYTLLCQRLFGGQPNKLISAMLGMGLFMVVLGPGIGASIAAVLLLPTSLTFLGTFPFTFCCLAISILILRVCGDLLDKVDYTGK